jgi:hypothetical protein
MKINPFLVISAILNLCSALWYFSNDGIKMGCLFITYTVSTSIFILLGTQ